MASSDPIYAIVLLLLCSYAHANDDGGDFEVDIPESVFCLQAHEMVSADCFDDLDGGAGPNPPGEPSPDFGEIYCLESASFVPSQCATPGPGGEHPGTGGNDGVYCVFSGQMVPQHCGDGEDMNPPGPGLPPSGEMVYCMESDTWVNIDCAIPGPGADKPGEDGEGEGDGHVFCVETGLFVPSECESPGTGGPSPPGEPSPDYGDVFCFETESFVPNGCAFPGSGGPSTPGEGPAPGYGDVFCMAAETFVPNECAFPGSGGGAPPGVPGGDNGQQPPEAECPFLDLPGSPCSDDKCNGIRVDYLPPGCKEVLNAYCTSYLNDPACFSTIEKLIERMPRLQISGVSSSSVTFNWHPFEFAGRQRLMCERLESNDGHVDEVIDPRRECIVQGECWCVGIPGLQEGKCVRDYNPCYMDLEGSCDEGEDLNLDSMCPNVSEFIDDYVAEVHKECLNAWDGLDCNAMWSLDACIMPSHIYYDYYFADDMAIYSDCRKIAMEQLDSEFIASLDSFEKCLVEDVEDDNLEGRRRRSTLLSRRNEEEESDLSEDDDHLGDNEDGGWVLVAEFGPDERSFDLPDLDPFGEYYFRMDTRLGVEEDNQEWFAGQEKYVELKGGAPSEPQGLMVDLVGGKFADLQWGAPASTGGAPIDEYAVEGRRVRSDGQDDNKAFSRSYITRLDQAFFGPLPADATYEFRVVARNKRSDWGLPSNVVSVTTSGRELPIPPRPYKVPYGAGDEEVTFGFHEVHVSGKEVAYNFELCTLQEYDEVVKTCNSGATYNPEAIIEPFVSLSITTDLMPNTDYILRVQSFVFGDDAVSGWSNGLIFKTPGTSPVGPFTITAEDVYSDAVMLSWEVGNNGGSDIKRFRLFAFFTDDDGNTAAVPGFPVTLTRQLHYVSDLMPGKEYSFMVDAFNQYGWSDGGEQDDRDDVLTITTNAAPPKILSFVADDPDDDSITFGPGDTLTVTFDMDTNMPLLTPTNLFSFFPPSGWSGLATGEWTSARMYTITCDGGLSADGSDNPILYFSYVEVKSDADLRSEDGTTDISVSKSPPLEGDFGINTDDTVSMSAEPSELQIEEDEVDRDGGFKIQLTASTTEQYTVNFKTSRGKVEYDEWLGSTEIKESGSLSGTVDEIAFSMSYMIYHPENHANGNDVIEFELVDSEGTTISVVYVRVTISPANDAPEITAPEELSAAVQEEVQLKDHITVADPDVSRENPNREYSAVFLSQQNGGDFVVGGENKGTKYEFIGSLNAVEEEIKQTSYVAKRSGSDFMWIYLREVKSAQFPGTEKAYAKIRISISCASAAPPSMASAQFSNDGKRIEVGFDGKVGTKKTYGSECSVFFESSTMEMLGSKARCVWAPDTDEVSMMMIYISSTSNIKVGKSIVLKSEIIRSCPEASTASSGSVAVSAPEVLIIPEVVFDGPKELSVCQDGRFSVARSQNTGIFPASYQWTFSDGVASAVDTTKSKVVIPRSSIDSGITYSVEVVVTNFMGASSTPYSTTFSKAATEAAGLTHASPEWSKVEAGTNRKEYLRVKGSVDTCLGGGGGKLIFQWSVTPDMKVPLDATSSSRSTLHVSPGSWEAGVKYTFTCQATLEGTDTSTSISFEREAEASDLYPIIMGGSSKMSSVEKGLTLDATRSFDPDQSSDTATYSWSCETGSGSVCTGNDDELLSIESGDVVVIAAGTLNADTYIFTLTFTKGSRTATTTQEVALVPGEVPVVELETKSKRISPNQVVRVRSTITSTSRITSYQWTDELGALDLSGISTTDRNIIIDPEKVPFNDETEFVLRLTVTTQGGTNAFAEQHFSINQQPFGGSLVADPVVGVKAETKFTVSALGWQDDSEANLLTYQFGRKDSNGQVVRIGESSSIGERTNLVLPMGDANNQNQLTLVVFVQDSDGAVTQAETVVTVTPPVLGDQTRTEYAAKAMYSFEAKFASDGNSDAFIDGINALSQESAESADFTGKMIDSLADATENGGSTAPALGSLGSIMKYGNINDDTLVKAVEVATTLGPNAGTLCEEDGAKVCVELFLNALDGINSAISNISVVSADVGRRRDLASTRSRRSTSSVQTDAFNLGDSVLLEAYSADSVPGEIQETTGNSLRSAYLHVASTAPTFGSVTVGDASVKFAPIFADDPNLTQEAFMRVIASDTFALPEYTGNEVVGAPKSGVVNLRLSSSASISFSETSPFFRFTSVDCSGVDTCVCGVYTPSGNGGEWAVGVDAQDDSGNYGCEVPLTSGSANYNIYVATFTKVASTSGGSGTDGSGTGGSGTGGSGTGGSGTGDSGTGGSGTGGSGTGGSGTGGSGTGGSSGLGTGVIIGIAAGGGVLLILIIVAIWYFTRTPKNQKQVAPSPQPEDPKDHVVDIGEETETETDTTETVTGTTTTRTVTTTTVTTITTTVPGEIDGEAQHGEENGDESLV